MEDIDKEKFLETQLNYGVILRGSFEKIEEVKKALVELDGIELIYQRLSLTPLRIIPLYPSDNREESGIDEM